MKKVSLLIVSFFVLIVITYNFKSTIFLKKENGTLVISRGGKTLLTYQYGIKYPPTGVDSVYQKSGFIHPVNTLNEHTLTRIYPEDHYHHFGIWNAWTKVLFEGDTIDFWNINGKQGIVKFSEFKNNRTTNNYATFTALQEHVVLKNGKNKIALNELQTVRVYVPKENYYIIDLDLEYRCETKSEFKILQYKYSGLGWRATNLWNDNNSRILTSEGNTRDNADNSVARWVMYQGELDEDYGGMITMSHPQNYSFPEPIRVWPKENHEGNVFVNFNPVKHKDWTMLPYRAYKLKYRFLVFNDSLSGKAAEKHWKNYMNNIE